LPFASVLLHHKFKQISAKWGKQWGKHYPHFVALFCIRKNNENAETLDNRAFGRIAVKTETIKLVPSGPLNRDTNNIKSLQTQCLQGFFISPNLHFIQFLSNKMF